MTQETVIEKYRETVKACLRLSVDPVTLDLLSGKAINQADVQATLMDITEIRTALSELEHDLYDLLEDTSEPFSPTIIETKP